MMVESEPIGPEYSAKLQCLAQRAAVHQMFIAVGEPDASLGDGAGPFTLRDAESGYDCHAAGVSLELLELQIRQVECEASIRRHMESGFDGMTMTAHDLVKRALRAMNPEARRKAEKEFDVEIMCRNVAELVIASAN